MLGCASIKGFTCIMTYELSKMEFDLKVQRWLATFRKFGCFVYEKMPQRSKTTYNLFDRNCRLMNKDPPLKKGNDAQYTKVSLKIYEIWKSLIMIIYACIDCGARNTQVTFLETSQMKIISFQKKNLVIRLKYHCESDMSLSQWKVTWNYSPLNSHVFWDTLYQVYF